MGSEARQEQSAQKPQAKVKVSQPQVEQKQRVDERYAIYEQGSIYLYQLDERISKHKVNESLAGNSGLDGLAIYNRRGERGNGKQTNLFASAPNVRNVHQLVNSYLVGYTPFQTGNIWVPLMTLSHEKEYQFDHLQFSGRKEVWQTSKESFNSPRGDCEDHAIALADWLIEMGEDARVVLGKYKNQGHAWVVLFKEGQEFLLEATWKFKGGALKRYPLATMYPDYHPNYMFNRGDFWFNQGSANTTDYSSQQWVRKSKYNG